MHAFMSSVTPLRKAIATNLQHYVVTIGLTIEDVLILSVTVTLIMVPGMNSSQRSTRGTAFQGHSNRL